MGGLAYSELLLTSPRSSRQALKKYVLANNNLGTTTDKQFSSNFNKALTSGSEKGVFARPKGTSSLTIASTYALSRSYVRCTI